MISKTIETIPDFVDKIIVVDDKSNDNTIKNLINLKKKKPNIIHLLKHKKNKGVGATIFTGYKKSLELDMDITAIMAGDNQMDPDQLVKLIDPIVDGKADYTKGNRLISKSKDKMPKIRQRGNAILTVLTKIASGYWGVMDPQNGYTAASKDVLKFLTKEKIYPRYGYCNDILVKLNIYNFRVMDIVMPPRYGSEKSGIKLKSYTPKLSVLLLKLFFYRINKKYGGINFHPLLFFYYLSFLLLPTGFILGLYILYYRIFTGSYSIGTVTLDALLLLLGVQFIMFALLFDEMQGKKLITTKNIKKRKFSLLNFHPYILFYIGGIIMVLSGLFLGLYILYKRITIGSDSFTFGTLLLVVLFLIIGFQSLIFGWIFDLENFNK